MSEISERAAVRRLHDRFGFGPRAGDLDAGFGETLDRLLAPAATSLTPPSLGALPAYPNKEDKAAKKAASKARVAQERKLLLWWLDLMAAAQPAATERLTWFWHGHFATSSQKVRSPQLMLAQNQTFRRYALGSFADLATMMITDAALIKWLDGQKNRKGSPNENLAREFMELFTLGVGHYGEPDVAQAARALTGWTVSRQSGQTRFVPARHDDGPETILGKTQNFDARSFAQLALAQQASAPFVVGRLWFRLVSATPPSQDAMRRLVAAYGDRGDVRATLRAIAAEPAFTDSASALVKQPTEWLIGLLRALGVRPSALATKTLAGLAAGLRGMGQIPFRPPSVGGWPAGQSWLTTSAGVARLHVAQLVAMHAKPETLPQTGDKAEAVRVLLGVDAWSARTKAALAGLTKPAQLVAVAACAPEYVVSG
jgi:uncharacterized protein (DUF1800 family)